MWCPPRRHMGRERLVAGLLPGLFRETYGMPHLTESEHRERDGSYQLGCKHKVSKRAGLGKGSSFSRPDTHREVERTLCYRDPPCSPQFPLASGKGEAWVKLRWPIHSSDR